MADPKWIHDAIIIGQALIGPTVGAAVGYTLVRLNPSRPPAKLVKEGMENSHLGWRSWLWDGNRLYSPFRLDEWPEDGELRAPRFSNDPDVRCEAGIHAHLWRKDWARLPHPEHASVAGPNWATVSGIVERFDRYQLGTVGWRAERVMIREIRAPSERVADAIRKSYPGVKVFVGKG